jgi:hypothetical protein
MWRSMQSTQPSREFLRPLTNLLGVMLPVLSCQLNLLGMIRTDRDLPSPQGAEGFSAYSLQRLEFVWVPTCAWQKLASCFAAAMSLKLPSLPLDWTEEST